MLRRSAVLALSGLVLLATGAPVASAAPASGASAQRIPGKMSVVKRLDVPTGSQSSLRRSASLIGGEPAVVQQSEWDVDYVGFSSNLAAKAAFEKAVDIWAGIVHSTVPIKVHAEFLDLGDPDLLGQAGSNGYNPLPGPGGVPTYYPDSLADAIEGENVYPEEPYDIYAEFNSATTGVYYGTNGQVPAEQVDFVSLVLHELGHGLGFSGSAGFDTFTSKGYFESLDFDPPAYMIYDRYLEKGDGVDLTTLANDSSTLGTALRQPLYWGGPSGAAANGSHVRMFAPNPFQPGSSIAHMDEAVFPGGNVNSLMTPFVSNGEAIHRPGPVVVGILEDLGWETTLSAPAKVTGLVSEPGTATVDLSWAKPAENGLGITGYTITATKDATTNTTVQTGKTTSAVVPIEAGHDYTFTVAAVNAVGTGPASDPTGTLAAVSDTTAPTLDLVAPPTETNRNPSFAFTSSDPGRPNALLTFTCSLDAATPVACTSPWTPLVTTSGAHQIDVVARDSSGNTTPVNHAFDADGVAPVVGITSGPAQYTTSKNQTFAFSATDDRTAPGAMAFSCKKDSTAPFACASGITWTGIADGVHTFQVATLDERGNLGLATKVFRVDTDHPEISTTPILGFTTATSVALRYAGSDPGGSGVVSYDVRYRRAPFNGAFGAYAYPASWQATTSLLSTTVAPRGWTYCMSVRSRDRAGLLSVWSAERCTATALDDRALAASTGWIRSSASAYYLGTISKSISAGRVLTRTSVQTRRVALVATSCSGCGIVGVYLNGALLKFVDLNAATTTYRRLILVKDLGAVKTGTITVKSFNAKRVYVDGLALSRT